MPKTMASSPMNPFIASKLAARRRRAQAGSDARGRGKPSARYAMAHPASVAMVCAADPGGPDDWSDFTEDDFAGILLRAARSPRIRQKQWLTGSRHRDPPPTRLVSRSRTRPVDEPMGLAQRVGDRGVVAVKGRGIELAPIGLRSMA